MKTKKEIIDFINRKLNFCLDYDIYLNKCMSLTNDLKEFTKLFCKDIRNNMQKELLNDILIFIYEKEGNRNEIN